MVPGAFEHNHFPMPEHMQAAQVIEEATPVDQLRRIFQKNLLLILAVSTIVFLGIAFYTIGQRKLYEATATLQIDPTPPSPLGHDVPAVVTMGADAFWNNQEYYSTQYRIIASRRTALETVRYLGLDRDAGFLKNLSAGQSAPAMKVAPEAAAAIVLSRLKVEPIKDSRLVTLTFEDADPSRARRVLSAVVDVYLQRNVDDNVNSNNSAGEWLRDQLVKLKQDLESSELALHDYKTEKQILSVSLDEQSNMLREEMLRLSQALVDGRTQREHIVSRARASKGRSGKTGNAPHKRVVGELSSQLHSFELDLGESGTCEHSRSGQRGESS